MKFNQLILPALTLLTSAVATGVDDCFVYWDPVYPPAHEYKVIARCPAPQNNGDVYTSSTINLNDCLVNTDDKIYAQER